MNQEPLPKMKLSHYRIVSKIGAGGMGDVYLAEDERLRRKIALKVLPESIAQDTDRLRRFEQEAFAASALNHPNILTIYEFGTEGATHFLASEFIDGETLRDRLQRTPLSLNETLDIAVQTAQALAAAHEANIIHRDIKPENVMLRKDGIVKVLDFGLAKLTEVRNADRGMRIESSEDAATLMQTPAANPQLTMPGTVMGTVAYMSPEQARGNPVDARTDLFSLGVMLYEMLARRQPFTGETINHVIVAILEKEPSPLATEIPAELTRILQQALAKQANERYPNAQAMLADLKKLQMRLLVEAENQRNSSDDEPIAAQTMILPQTTAAAPAALATAAASAQPTSPDHPKPQKWWLAAGLSLLVAVGGYFGYGYFTAAKQIESIAVMPFVNKSSDADSEYLSDGLAESLIYRLSQLPNLKVSPTSSVFRYKGKETDPQVIAKELGVDSVMTGRITHRGDNLTISVNLVDTRNGKSLWGEQYERKMSELLNTQREIASEITNKLQLKLSGASEQKLAKKYTDNNEAYQLYLKGRYHYAKRIKDDLNKGIEYFQQAVKLDPNFALAYAMIADSYNVMPAYPYLSPKEASQKSQAAAKRALELDPMLAEAHMAMATSLSLYDWNWVEAEREFKRAIELDPKNSLAHLRFAICFYLPTGRTDEAVKEAELAVELEPLGLVNGANLTWMYTLSRRNEDALAQGKKTHDLEPDFILGRYLYALAHNNSGMYKEALALTEKPLQADPANQLMLQVAGYAYAKTGRKAEANAIIARFKEIRQTQYVMSFFVATIYVGLSEKEKAFAELETAFQERDWRMSVLMKTEPMLDSLRDDPRFKDLLKRMGLPE